MNLKFNQALTLTVFALVGIAGWDVMSGVDNNTALSECKGNKGCDAYEDCPSAQQLCFQGLLNNWSQERACDEAKKRFDNCSDILKEEPSGKEDAFRKLLPHHGDLPNIVVEPM